MTHLVSIPDEMRHRVILFPFRQNYAALTNSVVFGAAR